MTAFYNSINTTLPTEASAKAGGDFAVHVNSILRPLIINPFGYPARVRKSFEKGLFQVVVSEPILEELADVFNRPRIREKYDITPEDIEEILTLIEERSEHVLLSGNIEICRDKDDNLIIETAIKGKAVFH